MKKEATINYPDYDFSDLEHAEQDGNYPVAMFGAFISQLIEFQMYDNEVQAGILAFVKSNGTARLSNKQRYHFDIVVSRFAGKRCDICQEEIPWEEVIDFVDEGKKLCSYHEHVMSKED